MKKKDLELEILKNYFTFEGKTATLKLVYNTFLELINENFGDEKIEKLNDKLFCDIIEAVNLLPKGYKLNLIIQIKDFGEYTKEKCEQIIKQNVYLYGLQTLKANNIKRASGFSLVGVGAIILLLSYLLRNYNLWFDLINISGTLFVWEGVNTAFIERNHDVKRTLLLAKSIKNIQIEGENKTKPSQEKLKISKK